MYSSNCSSGAGQQGLEGGAVGQLQQLHQRQLELGRQRPIGALHAVPAALQRRQQELPALVPGRRCDGGRRGERALHVRGPHSSEAEGKDGCGESVTKRGIKSSGFIIRTPGQQEGFYCEVIGTC